MKDLELSRGFRIPSEEKNYLRIDDTTLRASSRVEDGVIRKEIVPILRKRKFPVYPTTYIPRETILSTNSGIDAAVELLEERGFSEGEVFNQSWLGGTIDNDFRE